MIRSKDNVFIALVIIEILFISMTIGYSQENRVSAIKESA